ncbi:MAG: NAD-dependent epimerase/dehydratase family protein [Bacteroidetes bacterium]|nr:NAD-dependent epimerase/dehydratase family protein [Bacteroidota bacterium]
MKTIIITGSAGLIGSESVTFFHEKGFHIVGIDNNMRAYFFGKEASTAWVTDKQREMLEHFEYYNLDIRNYQALEELFKKYSGEIEGVIHTAAQPSHDWAAKEPLTDFGINANGTLNLLELTRQYCKDAVFIYTSTNKVYGDTPNYLPLTELEYRWEVEKNHPFSEFGIDEQMSIDDSKHSLFGASKLAADVMVQEYGKYFGMKTVSFRGGCLTGPAHNGAELHGFLAYLVECAVTNKAYTVFGYKGKQVRDNIHSKDLIQAFWSFFKKPRTGEVYNIGGSRFSNVSMLEAIRLIDEIAGYQLKYSISDQARIGDHIWYVSDVRKFQSHYPEWKYTYDIRKILTEMISAVETKLK